MIYSFRPLPFMKERERENLKTLPDIDCSAVSVFSHICLQLLDPCEASDERERERERERDGLEV